MRSLLLILASLMLFVRPSFCRELFRTAVAVEPVPVFNTPDLRAVFGGRDGRTLAVDHCGQLRSLEFVALPGTIFTIHEEMTAGTVYRVSTTDYPYPTRSGYFIDRRLVHLQETRMPERARRLPGREEIVARLEGMAGLPYVWGGNIPTGVEALLQLYPPAGPLDQIGLRRWQLYGVDCSGLLYAATDGFTPRNTSSLVGYGSPVAVAGRSVRQIVDQLAPLDLIVWPGHVLVVLDRERVIESRLDCAHPEHGVVVSPLGERLKGIMATRRPVDRLSGNSGKAAREFLVRRWIEEQG